MVAKINSGSCLFGVLAYNQLKVDEKEATVLFTNRIIEPSNGVHHISQFQRSFEPYLIANKNTEKPIIHISLNPDPKDKVSNEQFIEMANTYMERMGYGDQPYVVFKHEDLERHHIHIVSLRVNEQGKKIDHNYEFKRSMDVCRDLEQTYNLVPADQKKHTTEAPIIRPVNYQEGNLKTQISNIVEALSNNYKYSSFTEYKALLTLYNITAEEVKGETKGKRYQGITYSALDEKGNKVGIPLKSSSISKGVGMEALKKRMNRTQALLGKTNIKDRTKGIIAHAKEHCKGKRNDFEKHLAKNDISVLFRTNVAGRIYGATFIDHQTKLVLNGSRIGKEYSANVFEELFKEQKVEIKPTLDKKGEMSVMESKELSANSNTDHEVDLPFLNLGTDVEQAIFASRLQHEEKKRQRKRGRRM